MMLREATTADVPAIAVLWFRWAIEDKKHEHPDGKAWAEQQRLGIEVGAILCVVAVEAGGMLGFADGSLVYEPGTREHTLVGRHLYVRPGSRGGALGDRLMLRLLALGRQSGASCLVTHGSPTQRAVEKYLGKPMTEHGTLRIARW